MCAYRLVLRSRWLRGDLYPAFRAVFDHRVITCRIATIVPVIGLRLRSGGLLTLDINRRYDRCSHNWRIAVTRWSEEWSGIRIVTVWIKAGAVETGAESAHRDTEIEMTVAVTMMTMSMMPMSVPAASQSHILRCQCQ